MLLLRLKKSCNPDLPSPRLSDLSGHRLFSIQSRTAYSNRYRTLSGAFHQNGTSSCCILSVVMWPGARGQSHCTVRTRVIIARLPESSLEFVVTNLLAWRGELFIYFIFFKRRRNKNCICNKWYERGGSKSWVMTRWSIVEFKSNVHTTDFSLPSLFFLVVRTGLKSSKVHLYMGNKLGYSLQFVLI